MDNKITEQLTEWLNTPRENRDIPAGAMMLLRLNNNRFLYANILRRPDKFADKLEYELRKHLRIRLDGLTRADVIKLEAQVIPAAKRTLAMMNCPRLKWLQGDVPTTTPCRQQCKRYGTTTFNCTKPSRMSLNS